MQHWLSGLLFNRTTVTLALLATLIGAWNLYVSWHDDGILAGRVAQADGRPAGGATVTLFKQELIGLEKVAQVTTGAEGSFRFERHNQHHPILSVQRPSGERSPYIRVRLLFRNQNKVLEAPLIAP
jgi:hypothetical protein